MQKHFPVGKAQSMVLEALGLTAENFDHANAIFERIGILVDSKRAGRSVVPVVYVGDGMGGGFNMYGEGEKWTLPIEKIELTPIEPWMVRR